MTPKEANYKLSKTIEAFYSAFVDAGKHEIEAMLAAAKEWTPTNCWWVQYRAKDFIIKLMEAKLEDIEIVSKKINPMTTLTDNEKKFLGILEELDNDSYWGVAISEVIKNPEPVRVRKLITELKSQASDNYMVMQSIIGEPGIQCLQTL